MPPPAPAGLALTVALAQSGDRRALDRLLRDHQVAWFRHARAILRDEDAALDAVQASMLLVARRIGSLRDLRWFRAWAYRIVTREAVRRAKRRGQERLLIDDGGDDIDVAAPVDETAELAREAVAMIEQLPAAGRIVARLHYNEGLTLPEIAEALELPLGTVKSRLSYALVRLRNLVAA